MGEVRSQAVETLAEWLRAGPALALTGAGMSTDSGIPDYRGDGGDWRRHTPRRRRIVYRDFMRDPEARRRYWARSHIGLPFVARAQPNAGHRVVAALEQAGLVSGVVTQNVDGLHQRAGSRAVLDLHGRLDQVVCTSCGDVRPRVEIGLRLAAVNQGFDVAAAELAPDGDAELPDELVGDFRIVSCRRCGGVLKPDVVFFGESMPRERRDAAAGMLAAADRLLVLGSTLAVMSGYRLVLQASRARQPVAIVTRGASRGDGHAEIRIDAGLTETLTEVAQRLELPPLEDPRPAPATAG